MSLLCEMSSLPLYLVKLEAMRALVQDAQPNDSFFFYCTWSYLGLGHMVDETPY